MGILLVLDLVDVLKYRRIDEMNVVEVRVHLFPEDPQGELTEANSTSPDAGDG
jgi:hypothetical protein